jgi:hypothetical protein
LPQTPMPPPPRDLQMGFLSIFKPKPAAKPAVVKPAAPAAPQEKTTMPNTQPPAPSGFSLTGIQKIMIGLGMALLPTAINYVTGINWQDIGVSAQTASLISGSLAMILHMIPRPTA